MKIIMLAIVGFVAAVLPTTVIANNPQQIMVSMMDAKGGEAGYVMLKEAHNGLLIQVRMKNLPEGWHLFNIYDVGSCEEAFSAAMQNDTSDEQSNDANPSVTLPSIYANENGEIETNIFTQTVTLEAGPTRLNDSNGSSFTVHKVADTYEQKAEPGGLIACGVISTAQ